MITELKEDPLIYEFENQNDAADYDDWFRTKVREALESKKPAIPHDEVISRMRKKIADRLKNENKLVE